MTVKLADTHIHLEQYEPEQAARMLREFQEEGGEFVVAVSMNLESARRTERLAMQAPGLVRPAYGFHPEQPLPTPEEEEALFAWMEARTAAAGREAAEPQGGAAAPPAPLSRAEEPAASPLGSSPAAASRMAAVGEVGLPYYSRLEAAERGEALDEAGYVRLLERFVIFAARHDLPIVLHAVYEDADTVCDLLERHGIGRAHFHWFKGSPATVDRMITNGYFVSFTPDLLYEEEIRELACRYPDPLVMSETDGPWPFEGPFAGRGTHPSMTADVCREWARLRGIDESAARTLLLDNARLFYSPSRD
ncbi:TatD family hydrolase [Saccharibacillus deserti]|uniref:TatD family hydrolase n=1 Tax=Saccharibacillus deserti TaxID=1634444 RepID=UPI00155830C7|nr:TatD family hydrolase [Saccharibacillus deserti]